MQVGLVAFHYPCPEYRADMMSRVRRAAEVIGAMPGCLGVDCWLGKDGTAIVTTAKWESEKEYIAGFAAARDAGVDFTYDEREARPREIFRLSLA
jgi:heme-degrading monooxygenase HmoA